MSDTLQRLHDTEQEILDQIVSICEKHSIVYFLIYGTLLGSVRHKGFIPWDDDADIAMTRAEYEKFAEACKTDLPDTYFFHDINTDPLYWLPFAKVQKNGTLFIEQNQKDVDTHHGIWVDIFILDECKKPEGFLIKLRSYVCAYSTVILSTRRGLNKKINSAGASLLYYLTRPFSIKFLSKLRDKILSMQNGKKGVKYYTSFASYPDKNIYKKETFKMT
jgi:lipopolysaccharide cholinephosphotransferase